MPSANDVYITPADRKIDFYQSSAIAASISGSAADDLVLYTNGNSDQLVLDNGGNVGIGISAPDQKLHVAGNINIQDGHNLRWNNATQINILGSSTTGLTYTAVKQHFLTYNGVNAYSELMTLDDTGVGIRTTSPPSTLGIDGAVSIKERADHETVTAGWGQLWVKSASPNELYFTDDDGVDVQLGTGAGGANLTLSNLDVATAINTSLVSDADNTDDLGSSSIGWRKTYCKEYNGYNTSTAAYEAGQTVALSMSYMDGLAPMILDLNTAGGLLTQAATRQGGGSDSRIKENIADYNTGLGLIDALKLKTFTFKDGFGPSGTQIGVLTQDLEAIDSKYVNVFKEDDETYGDIAGISQEFGKEYRMALIKAVQELSAKNDALEARIAELEGKL